MWHGNAAYVRHSSNHRLSLTEMPAFLLARGTGTTAIMTLGYPYRGWHIIKIKKEEKFSF